MRQRLAIGAALAALCVALVVAVGAGDGGGGDYKVRAIFNNASFLIPGEDVKIAGAKVGAVESLDVTPDLRAAAVLKITDPGFRDFRSDAECQIRLQSVIGEKLVECQPTQPRPEGSAPPPPLKKIPDGQPGAGQRLLRVEQTSTPVTEDLIRDVMRMPYRQRFAIILNEFGTGLAGRGKDLRDVIRGASPALRQFDRVIKILARQNKILRDGAANGDRVLAEWAKRRTEVADFIVQANTAAQATAERRVDLEKNFQRFPAFLRELRPTMARLAELSDEMTPVFTNLGKVGPDISRLLIALAPFSRAGTPALRSLGETADIGRPALIAAKPTIERLGQFTSQARNLSRNLAQLLTSVDETNGIKYLMDLILNVGLSVNGFDQLGHYLRTALLAGCNSEATVVNPACTANFIEGASASSARSARANRPRTPLEKLLAGYDPQKVMADYRRTHGGKNPPPAKVPKVSGGAPAAPSKQAPAKPKRPAGKRGGGSGDAAVINYFLGNDR
jgi:phospholipid/cholesterol/gamma-HCH transport system substrate-binding protein